MHYLTNHSNSEAGTLDIIGVETRKHWYRGLRQAELIIRGKKRTLASSQRARERASRDIQLMEEALVYWRLFSRLLRHVPILGTWLYNKTLNQEAAIAECRESLEDQESLFRDCQLELEVATQEYEHILQAHPEATCWSYEQLESSCGKIALLEQKAAYITPREFARQQGISLELSIALFESSPEERHYLLDRVIRQTIELGTTLGLPPTDTASLPEEEAESLFPLVSVPLNDFLVPVSLNPESRVQ